MEPGVEAVVDDSAVSQERRGRRGPPTPDQSPATDRVSARTLLQACDWVNFYRALANGWCEWDPEESTYLPTEAVAWLLRHGFKVSQWAAMRLLIETKDDMFY